LIVTRGFTGLLGSVYAEFVRLGLDLDLEPFLQAYREFLLDWLDVNYLIGLYTSAFGRENIHVIPFELLQQDECRFLTLIESRLGLDHHPAKPGRVNPSLSPNELFWYKTFSQRVVTPLAARLDDKRAIGLYVLYGMRFVRPNALRPLIRLLDPAATREVRVRHLPAGYLDAFRGKAHSLKSFPLYEQYAEEYLLG
jgi:hypothetical protein